MRTLYLAPATPHPFLSGATAEELGQAHGAALVDPSYFWTKSRWLEHRRGLGLPDEPFPPHPEHPEEGGNLDKCDEEMGDWDEEDGGGYFGASERGAMESVDAGAGTSHA